MNALTTEERIERILLIGLPFMNETWAKFPREQDTMIAAFKNTKGFKEAKSALLALINEERLKLGNEIIGEDESYVDSIASGEDMFERRGIPYRNSMRVQQRAKLQTLSQALNKGDS